MSTDLNSYKKNGYLVKKNLIDDLSISAKSRWQLDENAPYMKGPGLKL